MTSFSLSLLTEKAADLIQLDQRLLNSAAGGGGNKLRAREGDEDGDQVFERSEGTLTCDNSGGDGALVLGLPGMGAIISSCIE